MVDIIYILFSIGRPCFIVFIHEQGQSQDFNLGDGWEGAKIRNAEFFFKIPKKIASLIIKSLFVIGVEPW